MNFKYSMKDITVVITTWANARMAKGAVASMKKHYPELPIIIIEDHSGEPDDWKRFELVYSRTSYLPKEKFDNDWKKLKDIPGTRLVRMKYHMGEGSCLDRAVDEVKTPLMFTMESDIRILKKGLIEKELEDLNKDPKNIFAVGPQRIEKQWHGASTKVYAWVKPVFSIWVLKAIRFYKVTFRNYMSPTGAHEGTGCFLHQQLTHGSKFDKPKIWRSVLYPQISTKHPEVDDYIYELKVPPLTEFSSDHPKVNKWKELIDG